MNESILNQIQEAIDKIISIEGRKESEINSNARLKYVVLYVTGAMSYVKGAQCLIEKGQYDSVLPLGRAFLEMYASIAYVMKSYNDQKAFDEYCNKLIVDDLVQGRKSYMQVKKDVTFRDENARNECLNEYIRKCENSIKTYFPVYETDIDQNNRSQSILDIVKCLEKKYNSKFNQAKADFIGKALEENVAYKNHFKYPYVGSYIIYPLLCSESHGNIGAVSNRATNNGFFSINVSHKENAFLLIDCIIWCLKDIAYRFEGL